MTKNQGIRSEVRTQPREQGTDPSDAQSQRWEREPFPVEPWARARFAGRGLLLPILALLSACDNVQWGGSDIEIVPPPPVASAEPTETDEATASEFGLPRGPVLFHIRKTAQGTQLVPVGELSGDSMRTLRRPEDIPAQTFEARFRETVIPTGAQFRVFLRGAAVGTFVAQSAGPVTPCGVPTAMGNVTVVAAAADAQQFLAFREGLSPDAPGEYGPPQITGSIRTFASIVAEKLILQAGLPRPRSWTGAQRDMQAVEVMQGGHPEMVATYLVGDSLAQGPAEPDGYSVFYLADYETARGYNPVYSEVHDYRRSGKIAPRLVDYLNWDGDPGTEVLLENLGRNDRWYSVISLQGNRWRKAWEGGRCR